MSAICKPTCVWEDWTGCWEPFLSYFRVHHWIKHDNPQCISQKWLSVQFFFVVVYLFCLIVIKKKLRKIHQNLIFLLIGKKTFGGFLNMNDVTTKVMEKSYLCLCWHCANNNINNIYIKQYSLYFKLIFILFLLGLYVCYAVEFRISSI